MIYTVCVYPEKRAPFSYEVILIFWSGADAVSTLGFSQQLEVMFYDQETASKRLPYACTCSLTVYLPRGVLNEEDLMDILVKAIRGLMAFGKVKEDNIQYMTEYTDTNIRISPSLL